MMTRIARRSATARPERDERGAALVEYALLVVLIAVVAIAGMAFLGVALNGNLVHSGSSIASAGS